MAQTQAPDPQAAITAFNSTVDALRAAAASASESEVKTALTAVADDFGVLADLLPKVIVDMDVAAAGEFAAAASNVQVSVTALQELCS